MEPARSTVDTHVLLSEVLDEIMERVARGDSPQLEEYAARYPEFEDILRRTMPALRLIHESSATSTSGGDLPLLAEPPRQLGDFRLRRQIGRGGMGMVYEADQQSMGRRVALKILPFAALADAKSLQRFKNEVRAASALDHPNIVSVYSVGEEHGVYFYAMQLIRGQNLSAVIQALSKTHSTGNELDDRSIIQAVSGPSNGNGRLHDNQVNCPPSHLTRQDALQTVARASDSTAIRTRQPSYYTSVALLGIQAARALQYAHELGIVHRDIKPANLLLDENARLYITDFGLATMEAHAGATVTGDVLGTLRYMPPEQALGKRELVDHRADVYSLGVTLYELLTLQPAFSGRDRQELLQQVTLKEPERPRKHQPNLPGELETIVMKAISKDRDDRYASAGELADDLQRFVENQPIRARPISPLTVVRKWTQRNGLLVTTALTLLLLATITTAAILARAHRQERQLRQQAERQEQRAERALQLARDTVDRMYMDVAIEWIAEDRMLSDRQRGFLVEARRYYQSLIDEVDPGDAKSMATTAVALRRIARIHHHAEEYGDAQRALVRSIAIWRELIATDSPNGDLRLPLRNDLMNLAALHNLLGQYAQATSLFDELQDLSRELSASEESDRGQSKVERANLWLLMAETAFGQHDWEQSQSLLLQAEQAINEYIPHNPGGWRVFDLRARHALGQMAVLRARGQLEEAEQFGRTALRNAQRIRTGDDDSRQTLNNELQLTRALAETCEERGNHQEAAELLEQTLRMSRETFTEQMSPAEVMAHAFFTPGFQMNDYLRPMSFCDYVNDQLRLSRILKELGRPHQAELLIAEAERTSVILASMFPASPRYHAAEANAYTELAMLLEAERLEQSHVALRQAARLWQRALDAVPEIATYESGLRAAKSDIVWFRDRFPENVLSADQTPSEGEAVQLRLDNHFTGIYLLRTGLTQEAIPRFEASLKQNPDLRVYDWLYLAKAHLELGDAEASRTFYLQAKEWIEQHKPQDEELAVLYASVAAKMGSAATVEDQPGPPPL